MTSFVDCVLVVFLVFVVVLAVVSGVRVAVSKRSASLLSKRGAGPLAYGLGLGAGKSRPTCH